MSAEGSLCFCEYSLASALRRKPGKYLLSLNLTVSDPVVSDLPLAAFDSVSSLCGAIRSV